MRTRLFFAALALMAGRALHAQSIAEQVRSVRDASVEMQFAARPGFCGDGRSFLSVGGRMRMGEFNTGRNDPCLPGPVRVRLRVDGQSVRDVRAYVGPLGRLPEVGMVVNIGVVPAREAAEYFLQLAGAADGKASTGAVLAAVLADSASVWRDLARIARDPRRPRSTRADAAFWLSRFASAKLQGYGEDLAAAEQGKSNEDDPRLTAVFALSQLRDGQAVPSLLQVARTNRDPIVRGHALFWLGQSGDPRGVDLMEEILRN